MSIPYMYSRVGGKATMTLYLGGAPVVLDETHSQFDHIIDNIGSLDPKEVRDLLDSSKRTTKTLRSFGNIKVENDTVYYKDEPVHSLLSERMLQMLEEGRDIRPWALFMENLKQNPAKHAVDELYLWLERSSMPITERGNFLAYKKVRDDYTSYHNNPDGTPFRNDVGTFVSMTRNKVDDDRNRTCSSGLHFCSWDYLPSYMGNQGKVVLLEINPAHVVSIPSDYNNAKGRAEAYLIVGELPEKEAKSAFPGVSIVDDNDQYLSYDYDEDIDYSGIEDNWYSNYDLDFYEEGIEISYDCGYARGVYDFYEGNAFDASEAIVDYEAENDYDLIDEEEDAFIDGYSDGYFNSNSNESLVKVAADELRDEYNTTKENESFSVQLAKLVSNGDISLKQAQIIYNATTN